MDHETEIPLDPGFAKVVIFYPHSNEERLLTLSWTEEKDSFTVQDGDNPPDSVTVFDPENIYSTIAHMASYLDIWRDDWEEWEGSSPPGFRKISETSTEKLIDFETMIRDELARRP